MILHRMLVLRHPISNNLGNFRKLATKPPVPNNHHHSVRKQKRPIVHLSSAPGEKYNAKAIGTPHPVVPHEVTPSLYIPDALASIKPSYANGVSRLSKSSETQTQLAIHDENSIQAMKSAAKVAAQILQLASSIVSQYRPGCSNTNIESNLTTNDIDIAVHNACIQHNAYPSALNYNGFPKSIRTSVNEVACDGIPDLRPLQDGDIVSLDVSIYLDGFHGDICAAVMVGQDFHGKDEDQASSASDLMDEDQIQRGKALIHATNEAMYKAIDVCRVGVEICEIGNVVQKVADQYGYRPMKKVCGHGIGSYLHMLPEIKVS
jgi:methionyl aminopeptidase